MTTPLPSHHLLDSAGLGPRPINERLATMGPGHDVDALGPSDSSDSGSDVQGVTPQTVDPDDGSPLGASVAHGSDTDASATGERASAGLDEPVDGADILPDQIVDGSSLSDADRERLRESSNDTDADDDTLAAEAGDDTPQEAGRDGNGALPSASTGS